MATLTFHSNGSALAGELRTQAARAPGILVMGSWTTVKEQMAARYARILADAGFAALTFDHRGFGASEGAPRDVESARSKAEDITNAIAFLRTRPEVDASRIGILAICASASYTALSLQNATPASCGVHSVAMVAPWIHDAALAAKLYGGAEGVNQRLAQARAARDHYAATGTVDYIPAASNTDKQAAMYGEGDTVDYYLNPARGAIPEWSARFAVMAWTEWLETDFVKLAPGLRLPLTVVTGDQTATPSTVKTFIEHLPSSPTVHRHAGTQFDFYDDPETVRSSATQAVEHFHATLRGQS